ncbi:hypothetical protein, partial [Streptomyces mirabilis]|uniref:hypothetical protein n=1 Tax=Streptomyces mirabilis TaxID=68239 RepID=UPI0033A60DCB
HHPCPAERKKDLPDISFPTRQPTAKQRRTTRPILIERPDKAARNQDATNKLHDTPIHFTDAEDYVIGRALLGAVSVALGDQSFEGGAHDRGLHTAVGVGLRECDGDLGGGTRLALLLEVTADQVNQGWLGRCRGRLRG